MPPSPAPGPAPAWSRRERTERQPGYEPLVRGRFQIQARSLTNPGARGRPLLAPTPSATAKAAVRDEPARCAIRFAVAVPETLHLALECCRTTLPLVESTE